MTHHVLVVDDDPLVRDLLATFLDHEEFRVTTVADGAAGLRILADGHPDVMVCDVVLPDIDGLEVCRRAKADPRTADTPVILLTGHFDSGGRQAAEAAGCDAYMTKPFRPLELLEAIRAARNGREDG